MKTTNLNRRSFLRAAGLTAAGLVVASQLPTPAQAEEIEAGRRWFWFGNRQAILYCDGVNSDSDGLEAWIAGKPVKFAHEEVALHMHSFMDNRHMSSVELVIDRTLVVPKNVDFMAYNVIVRPSKRFTGPAAIIW